MCINPVHRLYPLSSIFNAIVQNCHFYDVLKITSFLICLNAWHVCIKPAIRVTMWMKLITKQEINIFVRLLFAFRRLSCATVNCSYKLYYNTLSAFKLNWLHTNYILCTNLKASKTTFDIRMSNFGAICQYWL